jgi:hypothetical protein
MTRRFNSIRLLSTILKIFGWLQAGLSILAFLTMHIAAITNTGAGEIFGIPGSILRTGYLAVFMFALAVLASGLFSALLTYASGSFLMLMISIEENVRRPESDRYGVEAPRPNDLAPVAPNWQEMDRARRRSSAK